MSDVIMRVEELSKYFPTKKFDENQQRMYVKAVDNVTFSVHEGETLGIVGESGCGKSTLGRTMIRLQEPTDGRIYFRGKDISNLKEREMRSIRREVQIMFQDPYASLDPRMTVGDIIAEPLDIQKIYKDPKERLDRILELMELCGLNKNYITRYPHEFSGGQRQRIGIARALSVRPSLVICDEPVSSLDVSIQSQIINLLIELKKKLNLSLVFISHDLSVVRHIADRVIVMYLGRIMEVGSKKDIFENPQHPYTQALLSAIPVIGEDSFETMQVLEGELPSPVNPPPSCPFSTRCPYALPECSRMVQPYRNLGAGHFAACHRAR